MNGTTVRAILLSLLTATIFVTPLTAATTAAPWGARAAATDRDLSIGDMLRYAIEDEYLARAEYAAIMGKFGEMRPFSNIIRSEESHIAYLADAYRAAGLVLPNDGAAAYVVLPADLKEAFKTGVQAEIDNIAMYETFLSSPLLARPENADLKALFVRLRDASKNHLGSFQNQLARY
jgi:hypothetical protein